VHTILLWRDIKVGQFENSIANIGNPELSLSGASVGLDLALFYIRESLQALSRAHPVFAMFLCQVEFFSYSVESMLVFFW